MALQPEEQYQYPDHSIDADLRLEHIHEFVRSRVGRMLADGSVLPGRPADILPEYDFMERASMSDRGTCVSLWRNSKATALAPNYYDTATMDSETGQIQRWRVVSEASSYVTHMGSLSLRLMLEPFLYAVQPLDTPQDEQRRSLPQLLLTTQGCYWIPEPGHEEELEPLQDGLRRLNQESRLY